MGSRRPLLSGEILALLSMLTVSAPGYAQAPQPSPSPASTFPSGVELVTVDAVVLDKHGDPVPGLTAADFEVQEDGRPQTIASFEAVALPESAAAPSATRSRVSTNVRPEMQARRTFVIVFDNAHMAPERIGVARAAVTEFVKTTLRPGDEVTLVPTSGGAWWTAEMPDAGGDVAAALERLEALRPRVTSPDRVSDWEATQLYLHRDRRVMASVARRYYEHRLLLEPPTDPNSRAELQTDQGLPLIQAKAAEVYTAALERKRVTLAALERVARSLIPVKGRKSIILVSEGFVYEATLPEFRDLARATREANAAIYFLDARGLRGGPATADAEIAEQTDPHDMNAILNEDVLEAQGADSIALDSGGFSIKGVNDLAAGLRRIAQESRSYYLIGYHPERAAADGKFHKITVRVRRPGLEVRARRGYYAPGEGGRPRRDPAALDPALRQALDSPYLGEGIPLRMTAHVLGAATPGKANVVLVAEADPAALAFQRQGARFNDILESYVVVSSRNTGENFHREKTIELSLPAEAKQQLETSWLPVVREFDLVPGVYQARLLLRDREGGRVGTVRHEFTVPPLDGFRTSTPILTDTVQPPPAGSTLPPRPLPVARRRFAAGRTLYYVFEVYGAQKGDAGVPRVSAGFEIRRADGGVLAQQPAAAVAPGPGGELAQVFPFSLRGVPPGDYEVVLRVQDDVAAKTLEVRDPFTVAGP
jgi:VWFA-related protein